MEADTLGLQVSSTIGNVEAHVFVPPDQVDDPELDTDDFAVSSLGGVKEPPATGKILRAWLAEVPAELAGQDPVSLRRLLLGVTGLRSPEGPPRSGAGPGYLGHVGDELMLAANAWHDRLRSWVEVLTHQDLDHMMPRWDAHIDGVGLARFGADGRRLGAGGRIRLDSGDVTPAPRGYFEHAIASAGAGEYPPLAHLLLRDARAAWRRDQPRRALIDAATAAELGLTALADGNGAMVKGPTPLGRLVKELAAQGVITEAEGASLKESVVDPRNQAIHEGTSPTPWDAATACQAAELVVRRAFPFARRRPA